MNKKALKSEKKTKKEKSEVLAGLGRVFGGLVIDAGVTAGVVHGTTGAMYLSEKGLHSSKEKEEEEEEG